MNLVYTVVSIWTKRTRSDNVMYVLEAKYRIFFWLSQLKKIRNSSLVN
jgi:hypothetical protein